MLNKLLASADAGGGSFIETIHNPFVNEGSTGTSGNAGVTFLQKLIPSAIILGLIIGVVIFLFTLIIGAIQWISSGGDKQALESAKSKVTNAIIGLVVLFAIFAIIRLIDTFFGTTFMEGITLPTLVGS